MNIPKRCLQLKVIPYESHVYYGGMATGQHPSVSNVAVDVSKLAEVDKPL